MINLKRKKTEFLKYVADVNNSYNTEVILFIEKYLNIFFLIESPNYCL